MSSLCLCSRLLGRGPALVWKPHNCISFSAKQVNSGTALAQLHRFWTSRSQSKETWTCLHPSMRTSSENPSESPLVVNRFNFHSLWNYKRLSQFLCFCAVPFDFFLCKCGTKDKHHHLQQVSALAGPPWHQMGTRTAGWKAAGKLSLGLTRHLEA